MLTAASFTVAKTWKQPKTGAWAKKMWCVYIYTNIYIYIGKEAKALLPLSFKLINLESCPFPS